MYIFVSTIKTNNAMTYQEKAQNFRNSNIGKELVVKATCTNWGVDRVGYIDGVELTEDEFDFVYKSGQAGGGVFKYTIIETRIGEQEEAKKAAERKAEQISERNAQMYEY
jgi:hypothetical protein